MFILLDVELQSCGYVHGHEFLDEGLGCVGDVHLVDGVDTVEVGAVQASEFL